MTSTHDLAVFEMFQHAGLKIVDAAAREAGVIIDREANRPVYIVVRRAMDQERPKW